MTRRMKVLTGLLAVIVVVLFVVGGCGKAAEPFKDAERENTNDAPADTITMPDGFSNVATKCDHGNRLYSAFHGDSAYGAISVVANDPSCAGEPTE